MSKNKRICKSWNEKHTTVLNVRLLKHEVYSVHVSPSMTIAEVRRYLELAIGIPYDLQRLTYLDEAELVDTSTLRENEIVPGGAIELQVWPMWAKLVKEASRGDSYQVLELGVTPEIAFTSPASEYMLPNVKIEWMKQRAFVALCIGAHRGHVSLCSQLIRCGLDINSTTPIGRTALHIAASQGRLKVLELLIKKGIKLSAEDDDGFRAIEIAALFNHPESERQLFMSSWKQRRSKKKTVPKETEPSRSAKEEEQSKDAPYEPDSGKKPISLNIVPTTAKTRIFINKNMNSLSLEEKTSTDTNIDIAAVERSSTAPDKCQSIPNSQRNSEEKDLENNHSKDSLHSYLMSLKSQQSSLHYPEWVVDSHLQQLDTVNNTAKIALLKLQNDSEDKNVIN